MFLTDADYDVMRFEQGSDDTPVQVFLRNRKTGSYLRGTLEVNLNFGRIQLADTLEIADYNPDAPTMD